jgi:hypothetical protein
MPRAPKAKIQKAHNLSEQVLAIWQQDIREWATEHRTSYEVEGFEESIYSIVNWLRQTRVETERTEKP